MNGWAVLEPDWDPAKSGMLLWLFIPSPFGSVDEQQAHRIASSIFPAFTLKQALLAGKIAISGVERGRLVVRSFDLQGGR